MDDAQNQAAIWVAIALVGVLLVTVATRWSWGGHMGMWMGFPGLLVLIVLVYLVTRKRR